MNNCVVVVNSYRREKKLVEKSLFAILRQKFKPKKVIFVDQNPTPLQLDLDILQNPLFEIQISDKKSVSEARNSVKIPSDADWICFCDDDAYMQERYSEVLKALLESNQWDVIAGAVLREDTMDYYSLRHRIGHSITRFSDLKLLMGSNFLVRRELFDQVGRFDTRFGAGAYWGSSEETDFAWKCYFAKARITFAKELEIVHIPPFNESLGQGFAKSFRYARGKGAMVGKWLFCEKQPVALHELCEMSVIPFVQMARGIVTMKWALVGNNIGILIGRWVGLVLFLARKSERDLGKN